MKIDVTPIMTNYNGSPITEIVDQSKPAVALTFREVLCRALARPEQGLDWKEERRRNDLCRTIADAEKTVEMNSEDVVLLHSLISKFGWSPVISGASHDLLEPRPKMVEKTIG